MSKFNRIAIAQDTVSCIEHGSYVNPAGERKDLSHAISEAVSGTKVYSSEDLAHLAANISTEPRHDCTIRVVRASSFEASRAIAETGKKVLCLNFASAKNPGGGFLSGAQAQEEALTRSSALYACLKDCDAYYKTNRSCGTTLYTDTMIHSPDVPFFKDDNGDALPEPLLISLITAPAVNEGALRQNEPEKTDRIAPVMLRRTEKLLALAAHLGYEHLVLGAWGCGVFRNDPTAVAGYFHHFLGEGGKFAQAFSSITFAVLASDAGSPNLKAFAERFG